MTEREKAKELLNDLPDCRIPYVIGFILGLMALTDKDNNQNDVTKQD